MKNILIVDDHPVLLEGLEKVIELEEELRICGKAGSVKEALTLVEEAQPDLVLTDLTLPGRNGMELIKDLKAAHPDLPVLVMSMHDEMIYAERVLKAGGRGYVMKEAPSGQLLEAIRKVLGGDVFASQAVTNHFLHALSAGKGRAKASFPLERLTDREMEVFELIGKGRGNFDIATQLVISPRTVDAHRVNIRKKLALADGTELTRYAVRWIESGARG
jgi:DNA-binding NarL/FixJ family response regulator